MNKCGKNIEKDNKDKQQTIKDDKNDTAKVYGDKEWKR